MEIVQTNQLTPPETKPVPPWSDLLLYIGGGAGGFLLASLVASYFIRQLTLPTVLVFYALNIFFLAGSALLGARLGKLNLRALGFLPPRISPEWIFGGIAISLALLPVRGILALLVQFLSGASQQGLETRMDLMVPGGISWLSFIVTLVFAGILIPISEELFFRGALFGWFRAHYNFPVALVVSSALFGLAHFDSIAVVASTLILGVANAWLLEKTKTLWVPILMHMTTNTVAVLAIYALGSFAPQLLH